MTEAAKIKTKNKYNNKVPKHSFWKYFINNKSLYFFVLPGLIYLIIFHYIPMYGIMIAFKDFSITKGLFGSPWVGFENFKYLFQSKQFFTVFKNSIVFSMMRLAAGFPAPIILAILLNEVKHMKFKRSVQTISYIPHFISWVVVCGMVKNIVSPSAEGLINAGIKALGGKPIQFLISSFWFRPIVIISEIWKSVGWGAIIYLAALAGIDPTLYEAAIVDGASRWQRVWHVTIPGITSTIIILLILRMGRILNNGFEQIFLLYSPMVYDVADVFETYTYRTGLIERRFSYSTAVGLFKAVVGLIMVYSTNFLARRTGEKALW